METLGNLAARATRLLTVKNFDIFLPEMHDILRELRLLVGEINHHPITKMLAYRMLCYSCLEADYSACQKLVYKLIENHCPECESPVLHGQVKCECGKILEWHLDPDEGAAIFSGADSGEGFTA